MFILIQIVDNLAHALSYVIELLEFLVEAVGELYKLLLGLLVVVVVVFAWGVVVERVGGGGRADLVVLVILVAVGRIVLIRVERRVRVAWVWGFQSGTLLLVILQLLLPVVQICVAFLQSAVESRVIRLERLYFFFPLSWIGRGVCEGNFQAVIFVFQLRVIFFTTLGLDN